MKEDCIYWNTGCGQPMLKLRRDRRAPYDFYYPSYCDFCHDYRPDKTSDKKEIIQVEHIYQHINPQIGDISYLLRKVKELEKTIDKYFQTKKDDTYIIK